MKILLAVDGSEHSEDAARFLTLLDLGPDDEITVFHALHWSHFLYNENSYRQAIKELKKLFAPRIIDSILNILKPVRAKISTAMVEGPARQTIIEKAAEAGMDLIVMGARGTTGIESLLLGSVTRAVAAKSMVPVLVTKPPAACGEEKMKILFATDGSEFSISTQELLSSIPFSGNSEVAILNVIEPAFMDMYIPATADPEINDRFIRIMDEVNKSGRLRSGRIVEQARDYLSRKFVNIRVLSEEGTPAARILEESDNLKAGLIAAGCRGLTGLTGMMGSVSRNILSHSKCPVLIGKMCGD